MLLTTAQRVLEVPELLYTIFRFLEEGCVASNATVCRKWSEIALDLLWKEVEDPYKLFSILAPLSRVTLENEYEFERLPDSEDWLRFERYRRRVRRFSYCENSPTRILHHSVFDDIARTRTHMSILPNTHTLEWNAALPLCIMFMHSNVKRFHIHLPPVLKETSPRPFFLDISTRMPNLTHLDIRTSVPMRCMEEQMATLLSNLKSLRKIIFPQYSLTTKIFETLSRLDHLEVIEFQYFECQGSGDIKDVIDFNPSLSNKAFPVMYDFSVNITFAQAAHLFQIPYAPMNLTMLFLDSHLIETPAEVLRLLNILAVECPLLRNLSLITFIDGSTAVIGPPDKEDCINLETLEPLFRLSNLTTLELSHHYPLDLTQADIEKLSLQWPSIENLYLNSEPAYIDDPSLTLHALLPIAENCPNIRHIGLFVDASSADKLQFPIITPATSPSPSHQVPIRHPTSFSKLCRLSVGVSTISDPGAVASFLSQLCPLECHLETGVTWDECASLTAQTVHARCDKWAKVQEMLPLLTSLRMEERQRVSALQQEVEDLRLRTTVLQGRECIQAEKRPHDSCTIS